MWERLLFLSRKIMPMPPMIINPLMIQIVLESAVGVGEAIVLSAVGAEGVIGVSSVGDEGAFDGKIHQFCYNFNKLKR